MEPEKTHEEKGDKPDQKLFIQRNMLEKRNLSYAREDDPVSQDVKDNEEADLKYK